MINPGEKGARIFMLALLFGLLLGIAGWRWYALQDVTEIHALMPESGGWSPENITASVGEPLKLRLVSDDVLHGFAIGQSDQSELVLNPGQPVETTLLFDEAGKYVFYCTRWCGLNHWRMRGTIDVSGPDPEEKDEGQPPYLALGLDIDAEHLADAVPERMPSASRGAGLGAAVPAAYLSEAYYQSASPSDAWKSLRGEAALSALDDHQIWDLVAWIWSVQTTPDRLEEGKNLYQANCAACHAEDGAGDGVMAEQLINSLPEGAAAPEGSHDPAQSHGSSSPPDFRDPSHMLGASPAVLHGKILRGGMGTGMPYWGPIFTQEQIWNIVSYLWGFQFEMEAGS